MRTAASMAVHGGSHGGRSYIQAIYLAFAISSITSVCSALDPDLPPASPFCSSLQEARRERLQSIRQERAVVLPPRLGKLKFEPPTVQVREASKR